MALETGIFPPFFQGWDFYVVLAFSLGRIALNLEKKKLSIFFVVSYLVFILWMFFGVPFFSTAFVLFLIADSMIGTYLAAENKKFNMIYFGTMALNFVIIILLIQNFSASFLV